MNWRYVYVWQTSKGPFYIAERDDGRYLVVFDDENLGSYDSPAHAAGAAANGDCDWPSSAINPMELGISEELSEWQRVKDV